MPDLLLELFSEEIPARMQAQATDDLRRLVTEALRARGLTYMRAPRALPRPGGSPCTLSGLPARQPDTREEKRGPRVGAPDAAVQGFLKSAGLASLAEAKIQRDPKKGEFYVAIIEHKGRDTLDVLAEVLPAVIKSFPWPKSMRWGAASARADALRWVRPLHAILATFGPETEDTGGGSLRGRWRERGQSHLRPQVHGAGQNQGAPLRRLRPGAGESQSRARSGATARHYLYDARDLALAQGLELVEDEALLHEVAGLVEWPVVLTGEFDRGFSRHRRPKSSGQRSAPIRNVLC